MANIGMYKGVRWQKQRICDVLAVDTKARWYFPIRNGKFTGDHFKTIAELKRWIDSMPAHGDWDRD